MELAKIRSKARLGDQSEAAQENVPAAAANYQTAQVVVPPVQPVDELALDSLFEQSPATVLPYVPELPVMPVVAPEVHFNPLARILAGRERDQTVSEMPEIGAV